MEGKGRHAPLTKVYIDGYNVLFALYGQSENLRPSRDKLIRGFRAKADSLQLSLILVFDSHYQKGESTRAFLSPLQVVYTAEKESADDYIIQAVSSDPQPPSLLVVTSDKTLAKMVRDLGAKTQGVDLFLSWLGKRGQNLKKRKAKEASQETKSPPTVPPIPKRTPLPGSLDYYEELFEQKLPEKMHTAESPKELVKKTRSPPKLDKCEPEEDFDRWLHIFESREKPKTD